MTRFFLICSVFILTLTVFGCDRGNKITAARAAPNDMPAYTVEPHKAPIDKK
jgi:hypothetical protein